MGAITAAVTAAAAIGSAYTAHKSAKFTERSAKKSEEAAEGLLAEEEKTRKQTAFSILKRRKGGEAKSARDTILTSPLGVTGGTGQAGKKLLGE